MNKIQILVIQMLVSYLRAILNATFIFMSKDTQTYFDQMKTNVDRADKLYEEWWDTVNRA